MVLSGEHGLVDYRFLVDQIYAKAPIANRHTAHGLMSSVLRYHQLTHSLHVFSALLTASLQQLFPSELDEVSVRVLYELVIGGPLVSEDFHTEFFVAIKRANPGGYLGTSWSSVIESLAQQIETGISVEYNSPSMVSSKKRRLIGRSHASKAAVVACLSRLLVLYLRIASGTNLGGPNIRDAVGSVSRISWAGLITDKPSNSLITEHNSKRKFGSLSKLNPGQSRWVREVILASELRVKEAIAPLMLTEVQNAQLPSTDVLEYLEDRAALPELRIQAVSSC